MVVKGRAITPYCLYMRAAYAARQLHVSSQQQCTQHDQHKKVLCSTRCASTSWLLYALCRTSAHIDLIAGLGMVDLDDVAAAHVLATVLPEARGRYVLCERFALMSEMAGMMR